MSIRGCEIFQRTLEAGEIAESASPSSSTSFFYHLLKGEASF